jgi:predicted Fe-Mo cluster-binding NifX family protein
MKICIPTNEDRGLESRASTNFGSAPFFVMADVENAGVKVVRNPECHGHHQSCHHVPLLEAHEVDAVVCAGIGRRAASGLRAAGIDVLVPPDRTVSEIVAAVGAGRALSLSDDEAHGGRRRRHRHRAGGSRGRRHGHESGRRGGWGEDATPLSRD